jgi:hypothetical protein
MQKHQGGLPQLVIQKELHSPCTCQLGWKLCSAWTGKERGTETPQEILGQQDLKTSLSSSRQLLSSVWDELLEQSHSSESQLYPPRTYECDLALETGSLQMESK